MKRNVPFIKRFRLDKRNTFDTLRDNFYNAKRAGSYSCSRVRSATTAIKTNRSRIHKRLYHVYVYKYWKSIDPNFQLRSLRIIRPPKHSKVFKLFRILLPCSRVHVSLCCQSLCPANKCFAGKNYFDWRRFTLYV